MKIELLHDYGGVRVPRGQRLQPGIYELDAPELFGLGQYLVDTGHARVIETEPEDVTSDFGTSFIVSPEESEPEEGVDTLPVSPEPRQRRKTGKS